MRTFVSVVEAVVKVVEAREWIPVKLVADQFGLDVVEEDAAESGNYQHPHHTIEEREHHHL